MAESLVARLRAAREKAAKEIEQRRPKQSVKALCGESWEEWMVRTGRKKAPA